MYNINLTLLLYIKGHTLGLAIKSKVVPYSITRVGLGADPGLLAVPVSPGVT